MGDMRHQTTFLRYARETSHRLMGHFQTQARWLATGELFNRHALECGDFTWPARACGVVKGAYAAQFVATTEMPNPKAGHSSLAAQFRHQGFGILHGQ